MTNDETIDRLELLLYEATAIFQLTKEQRKEICAGLRLRGFDAERQRDVVGAIMGKAVARP